MSSVLDIRTGRPVAAVAADPAPAVFPVTLIDRRDKVRGCVAEQILAQARALVAYFDDAEFVIALFVTGIDEVRRIQAATTPVKIGG